MGWLTLPGVLLALATAVLACLLFFHCPKRPRWVKILTLALAVPALFLAVDGVICHIDMWMTKHRDHDGPANGRQPSRRVAMLASPVAGSRR